MNFVHQSSSSPLTFTNFKNRATSLTFSELKSATYNQEEGSDRYGFQNMNRNRFRKVHDMSKGTERIHHMTVGEDSSE